MIHIELLYHQALAEGLDKRYEFKSRLADLYIQQISEQARAKISDQLIQNEFDQNKDQYQQVSARHILIRFGDKKDAKAKQEIISKLTEIRKAALEDPTKFPDLAMKNSQDGSAASGGELGFFNPGMMVAPFSKAAFNLKRVGDISEIVETEFGFHIIQLSGDHRGIEFHKDTIKDRLLRATQRTRLDEELARLKKEIKTEVYEDTLSKLSPLPGAVTTDPETLVPKNEPSNKSP
jgi:peptidyl-prolyl cis-trans isomerase D